MCLAFPYKHKADVKKNMMIAVSQKILVRASGHSWDFFDAQQEEKADIFESNFNFLKDQVVYSLLE